MFSGRITALIIVMGVAGGFLVGSQISPNMPVNSMLADAQMVAQDRQVRYIGYLCGDDGATVIARQPPTECREVFLLSETDEFKAPPPVRDAPRG